MRYPYFLFLISLSILVGCNRRTALVTTDNGGISNFDYSQENYIKEGLSDAPMRVWKINIPSDSILLRQKSTDVVADLNDVTLRLMTERLLATVQDSISLGVGIAAPQVGILKNIIWVQRFDKPDFPFEVYLNPVIKQYSTKKQPCMEGCLSIPNLQAETQNRAYAILLEYDKMDGTHITEMVEDFTAVIFQHEIDHLHGIMFTDHLAEEMEDAGK